MKGSVPSTKKLSTGRRRLPFFPDRSLRVRAPAKDWPARRSSYPFVLAGPGQQAARPGGNIISSGAGGPLTQWPLGPAARVARGARDHRVLGLARSRTRQARWLFMMVLLLLFAPRPGRGDLLVIGPFRPHRVADPAQPVGHRD